MRTNGNSNGTSHIAKDQQEKEFLINGGVEGELVLMASVLKNYEKLPAPAREYVRNRIA